MAVAISGNYSIIAAPSANLDNNKNTGAAYIFERGSDGNWNQTAKLVASDRVEDDYFGSFGPNTYATSISIDGNYAIVGVPYRTNRANSAAFIYKRDSDGSWGTMVSDQTYSETMKYPTTGNSLGISVGVSNRNFIISQRKDNGKAYISKFFSTESTLTIKGFYITSDDITTKLHIGRYNDSSSGSDSIVINKSDGNVGIGAQILRTQSVNGIIVSENDGAIRYDQNWGIDNSIMSIVSEDQPKYGKYGFYFEVLRDHDGK